jgi:hypothetical protein
MIEAPPPPMDAKLDTSFKDQSGVNEMAAMPMPASNAEEN